MASTSAGRDAASLIDIPAGEAIEAVHGHARTLALLAPALKRKGVAATREALVNLMADMDRRFPGQRERSLFASVELSLCRLSPENRNRARVLGVFHGGVDVDVLRVMMEWHEEDVVSLARELVGTGLATLNRYNHLSLDPALCPYLRNMLDDAERDALTARWVDAMRGYVGFLGRQRDRNTELAATLTRLELPNLRALLAWIAHRADAEATVDLTARLQGLLEHLGRPRLLAQVGEVRDAAAAQLGATWSHARFQAACGRLEEQLASGRLPEALAESQALLRQARGLGEQGYPGADFDLGIACVMLARVLVRDGPPGDRYRKPGSKPGRRSQSTLYLGC